MTTADFLRAVRDGDLGAVRSAATADRALLRATTTDCFGATALLHAVNADNRAMVDLLLDLGADIDQRSDWENGSFGVLDSATDQMAAHLLSRGATLTPHAAARLGMIDRLRAMLAADPSLVNARGGDGQLPLHFARTTAIADLLLEHRAKIDALDVDHGATAAQWRATAVPEVSAHLVSRGAAPDPVLAACTGDLALLGRLVSAEPEGVRMRITRGRFPARAPAAGHIYLYAIGEGCGLVHAAAGRNRAPAVRWLAAKGADVNARAGYDDATPLHLAAWNDAPEAAATLLDAGAGVDTPSGALHRNQPIGWAIVSGALATFRVLKDRGATVHPHHVEDARAGAAGQFRCFNRERPMESWREIARVLGA